MEQREVTDKNNTTWTCVQAYAGVSGQAAEKATDLAETSEGTVTVVCTPSGGEQTVRLELQTDWLQNFSDEKLLEQLEEGKKSR
jgi:Na+-translocating ferredoxin:NAD+ oxidoreductase RnfC subunit